MKIAFIGSHGVGKTTLCYELAARLKKQDRVVDLVMEVARGCPLPINRDTTIDAQAWILHTQVAQEIAAAARGGVVVCDRSVLDNYAYLVHATGRRASYDALVGEWVATYHALIKVPVLDPPSFDGTRDTSMQFQLEIDRLIDTLADAMQVRCVLLDVSRRNQWVDDVLRASGLSLHPPQISLF